MAVKGLGIRVGSAQRIPASNPQKQEAPDESQGLFVLSNARDSLHQRVGTHRGILRDYGTRTVVVHTSVHHEE